MKYLRNNFMTLVALFIVTATYSQDNREVSDLKDFQGIWKFIPPEAGYDSMYYAIKNNIMLDITYWIETQKIDVLGQPYLIGFADGDLKIKKLSDLKNRGQRLYFYESIPNTPNPPNDSVKYYYEARMNCFASFNGIGTDDHFHMKGYPNFLLFNFNGRDYEVHVQLTHLPNFIVKALKEQKPDDWVKVRQLLPHDYKLVQSKRTPIYSSPELPTKMYLIKGDVAEILEEKGDWLRINYYPEKDGKETGKTIEGWIRKTDME